MQRGMASILAVQHAMGHELVVFTREPRMETDFELGVPFRHVVIGDAGMGDAPIPTRALKLRSAMSETRCDLVVHHEYYAKYAVADLRLIEEMGIPAVFQWHSCFSALNMESRWDGHVLEHLEGIARHVACFITLSSMDKTFFELMGVPAVHIPYADPDLFDGVPVHGDGHKLLWSGRIVPEKRPLHALQILEKVLERFPDAMLTMLGDGSMRVRVEKYLAERPELAEHVVMPGFVNDVAPYLREADVYLVTTTYEGFMHSLVEAKMAALPTVGYRMDYLDTTRPGTGYCTVPQGDVDAAAAEVCRLLADPDERRRLGALARKDFESFLRLDLKSLYAEAFEVALHRSRRPQPEASAAADVLRVLLDHVDSHARERMVEVKISAEKSRCLIEELRRSAEKDKSLKEKLRASRNELRSLREKLHVSRKKLRRLKKELRTRRGSWLTRMGRALVWPVRRLKRMLSR